MESVESTLGELGLFSTFIGVFVILCIGSVILFFISNSGASLSGGGEFSSEFKTFQRSYLLVYFTVMLSDWLQGPYVYALYKEYGFGKAEIGQLFVAGFSSSMVMGTFIGSLADNWGRRKLAVAFCVIYGIGCVTKLFPSYAILMIGRLLSGIATSLLFSVFEAWMVSEHKARHFPDAALSHTFSLATFGNGLVAIGAGLGASVAARLGGFVAPFLVALMVLVVAAILIQSSWTENYGDASIDISQGFKGAIEACRDSRVWLLGLCCSLFEGSMYSFVFMWSPVLISSLGDSGIKEDVPFGLVFACFMVCIMMGSSLFQMHQSRSHSSVNTTLTASLALSTLALSTPLWTNDWRLLTFAFLLMELACGLYFPSAGTLRGRVIPERVRSSVMNLFRVPLNLIVVGVLLNVDNMSTTTVFALTTSGLLVAIVAHQILQRLEAKNDEVVASKTDKEPVSSGH